MQVLILDDWGLTPLTAEQRRDLLEIIDDRHGRTSTVVTANCQSTTGMPTSAIPPLPTRCSTASSTTHTGLS
jgi:DNA replication protein DnaC